MGSTAMLTGVLLFCALWILVIGNIEDCGDGNSGAKSSEKSVEGLTFHKNDLEGNFAAQTNASKCISDSNGGVVCSNIDFNDLCGEINKWVEDTNKQSVPLLTLNNIRFEDNQIQKGWLDNVTLEFTRLFINDQYIIASEAFSGHTFTYMTGLALNNGVKHFQRNMFEGSNIKNLEIYCDGFGTFEENAFAELSQGLIFLSLSYCVQQSEQENLLQKIFGSTELLPSLQLLDLRGNDLRRVKASSFTKVPAVKRLFLGGSKITEIELHTFDSMYLDILDSTNNFLTTLPEGIFKNSDKGIAIAGNYWRCDCDLVWLRDLYNNFPNGLDVSQFMCQTEDGQRFYQEVDFCPDSNETTKSSTPTATAPTITTTTASSGSTTTSSRTTITTPTTTTRPESPTPTQLHHH